LFRRRALEVKKSARFSLHSFSFSADLEQQEFFSFLIFFCDAIFVLRQVLVLGFRGGSEPSPITLRNMPLESRLSSVL